MVIPNMNLIMYDYYSISDAYTNSLSVFIMIPPHVPITKPLSLVLLISKPPYPSGKIDTVSVFYCDFASDVALNLGDKKWARKIYKEAEKDHDIERRELADSIIRSLGDKEWAKKVREKT